MVTWWPYWQHPGCDRPVSTPGAEGHQHWILRWWRAIKRLRPWNCQQLTPSFSQFYGFIHLTQHKLSQLTCSTQHDTEWLNSPCNPDSSLDLLSSPDCSLLIWQVAFFTVGFHGFLIHKQLDENHAMNNNPELVWMSKFLQFLPLTLCLFECHWLYCVSRICIDVTTDWQFSGLLFTVYLPQTQVTCLGRSAGWTEDWGARAAAAADLELVVSARRAAGKYSALCVKLSEKY